MALYLTVSEGPSPLGARPILAVSDQTIIGNLLRSLGHLNQRSSGSYMLHTTNHVGFICASV